MAAPPYTMGQSPWVSMVAQLQAAHVQLVAAQTQLAAAQAQIQAAEQQAQQSAKQSEETMKNNLQKQETNVTGAADFLLSNSEYHDCFLTVGNPERDFYQEVNAQSTLGKMENESNDTSSLTKSIVCNESCVFRPSDYFEVELSESTDRLSSLEIIPRKSIEIGSFTCKSRSGQPDKEYEYTCDITITKTTKTKVRVEGSALYNDDIVLPLKFNSGKPIVMNPGEQWDFDLNWENEHPVHKLIDPDDDNTDSYVTSTPVKGKDMKVKQIEPFHVVQVTYKKKENKMT